MPPQFYTWFRQHIHAFVVAASVLVLLGVWISTAWVGEDPQITFRTIDNFVNGYGLRWNIDERVQTYTHPLWLLVLSAVYYFTNEIEYTTTAVSLVCSVSTFVILAYQFRSRSPLVVLAILIAILSSHTLTNFATSGFENPLSHLLLLLFATTLIRSAESGEVPWLLLCAAAALGAVNRLDAGLLYAPALVMLVLTERRETKWMRIALGFLPLAAWLLFSLFYYGFFFPNTAPAKLSAAMPRAFYTEAGLRDILLLCHNDLGSAVILLLGLAFTAVATVRFIRDREDTRSLALASLGAGMLLYALYIKRIGGHGIVGRPWSAPLWLAVTLIAYHAEWAVSRLAALRIHQRIATVVVLVLFVVSLRYTATELTLHVYGRTNVGKLTSRARTVLESDLTWRKNEVAKKHHAKGEVARRGAETGQRVVESLAVGFFGLAAGRDTIILDSFALTDPLLARLRPRRGTHRTGHLMREIPVGYVEARETGSLSAMHPALRRYYRALRLLISGPLWSWERVEAIVRFNLGRFDPSLEEYEKHMRRQVRPEHN